MFRMLPAPACAKALPWDEVGQLEILLLLSRRGSRARRATDLQDKPVQVFLDCFLRRIWAFGSFEFSRFLGYSGTKWAWELEGGFFRNLSAILEGLASCRGQFGDAALSLPLFLASLFFCSKSCVSAVVPAQSGKEIARRVSD